MKRKIVSASSHAFAALVLSGLAFVPFQGHAQKPTTPYSFEIIPDLSGDAFTTTSQGRFDALDGHAVVLYNLNDPTQGSDPTQRALAWVQSHKQLIGFTDEAISGLNFKHVRNSSAGSTVRFTQSHLGLPVHQAEFVVNMDTKGMVRYVYNGCAVNLPEQLPASAMTVAATRDLIINTIGLQGPLQYDRSFDAWFMDSGTLRRVVVVKLVGSDPIGDFEAIVDAASGEVLSLKDLACSHHDGHDEEVEIQGLVNADHGFPECAAYLPPAATATGSGFVYDADPLSQMGVAYGGAYVDGTDATNASLDAARVSRTLNDITFNGSLYSLEGPYAAIREFENPNRGLFAQASPTFNFNRFDNAFEGVNTYYFIDMSMRYLNLTLGVSVMPYQYTTGVQFDAHGLNGADNSHYVGTTGRLAFGEGGVDDAEDSDVILHELGHGLHDWITVGGLSNVQGLSEGTGDYWTQSHSRSLGQWTVAQPAYQWVFNWDGHNPFWGGRITNYTAAYPGGLTGAIHTDGQIWSTCLMKIYDAIGRTPTDKALWEGLAMTGGTTNQQDAAIAVRQAAINMGYTATQINTISTLLAGCGYVLPVILNVGLDDWNAVRTSSKQVELAWTTVSESGNDRFVVERKLENESEYRDVATLAGNAHGSGAGYELVDENAFAGKSFYRLRFEDLQGGETWSEVREVEGSAQPHLMATIVPNPSEGSPRIELVMPDGLAHKVGLKLMDTQGRTLATAEFQVQGQSVLSPSWNENLPAGIYIVELSSEGTVSYLRWHKR